MSNDDLVLIYTQQYADWLDEHGYPRPAIRQGNRLPQPGEILTVLRAIPDSTLEVDASYAFVSPQHGDPPGAYWLRLQPPARRTWWDESWDGGDAFTIKGSYAHELPVVIALTRACGQLVIYPDTGATPLILDSTDDPATILRLLAQTAEDPDPWQAFHRRRYR